MRGSNSPVRILIRAGLFSFLNLTTQVCFAPGELASPERGLRTRRHGPLTRSASEGAPADAPENIAPPGQAGRWRVKAPFFPRSGCQTSLRAIASPPGAARIVGCESPRGAIRAETTNERTFQTKNRRAEMPCQAPGEAFLAARCLLTWTSNSRGYARGRRSPRNGAGLSARHVSPLDLC